MSSDPPRKDHPTESNGNKSPQAASERILQRNRSQIEHAPVVEPPIFSSADRLLAAGFSYTGAGNAVRCDGCGWTADMDPYTIHAEHCPHCPFICSTKVSPSSDASTSSTSVDLKRNALSSSDQENVSKRPKTETVRLESLFNDVFETELIQQMRGRTFSHWPHRTIHSSAQMIEAGFFKCNVGDRVICIYCNLICQQWTPHIDDPSEVHKTLSPNCRYVKEKLVYYSPPSVRIINESSAEVTSNNPLSTSSGVQPLICSGIAYVAANHSIYAKLSERSVSFAAWPRVNLPSVDDIVRAGFFYTKKGTTVACFYCNGSLQNWGPNDNPMVEHARWFPHCEYAKQLCGNEIYRKIQNSERIQQESGDSDMSRKNTDSGELLIKDENDLAALVFDRLKLPMSRNLLAQHFKFAVVKRCWEDQLRIKKQNFVSEYDLYVACLILQKQIEHINGKKENIVIPSIRMKQLQEQSEACKRGQISSTVCSLSNTTDVDMSGSSQSSVESTTTPDQNLPTPTLANPCVLCLVEEKRLACIPCGHLAICTACSPSLRLCPICRQKIEVFVKVYM